MKKVLVSLLAIGLLVGCASSGRKIDQSSTDRIERGVTTKSEVIANLGSPDQITRQNDTTIFLYRYSRVALKGASYIPYIGPFVGGPKSQHQMVMVMFDKNDVVTNVTNSYGASETGLGASSGCKPALTGVEADKRPR